MSSKKKVIRKVTRRAPTRKSRFSHFINWVSRNLLLSSFIAVVGLSSLFLISGRPSPNTVMLEVAGSIEDYVAGQPLDIFAITPMSDDPEVNAMIAADKAQKDAVAAGKDAAATKTAMEKAAKKAAEDTYKAAATSGVTVSSNPAVSNVDAVNKKNESGKTQAEEDAAKAVDLVVNTSTVVDGAVVYRSTTTQKVDASKSCQVKAGFSVYKGETIIGASDIIYRCGDNGWEPVKECGEKSDSVCKVSDVNTTTNPNGTVNVTVKPSYMNGGKNCYNGSIVIGNGSIYTDRDGKKKRCDNGNSVEMFSSDNGRFYTESEKNDLESRCKEMGGSWDEKKLICGASNAQAKAQEDSINKFNEQKSNEAAKEKECLDAGKTWNITMKTCVTPGVRNQGGASDAGQMGNCTSIQCPSNFTKVEIVGSNGIYCKCTANSNSSASSDAGTAKKREDDLAKVTTDAAQKQAECRAKTSVSGQIKTTYKYDVVKADCVVDTVVDLATGKTVAANPATPAQPAAVQPDQPANPLGTKSKSIVKGSYSYYCDGNSAVVHDDYGDSYVSTKDCGSNGCNPATGTCFSAPKLPTNEEASQKVIITKNPDQDCPQGISSATILNIDEGTYTCADTSIPVENPVIKGNKSPGEGCMLEGDKGCSSGKCIYGKQDGKLLPGWFCSDDKGNLSGNSTYGMFCKDNSNCGEGFYCKKNAIFGMDFLAVNTCKPAKESLPSGTQCYFASPGGKDLCEICFNGYSRVDGKFICN